MAFLAKQSPSLSVEMGGYFLLLMLLSQLIDGISAAINFWCVCAMLVNAVKCPRALRGDTVWTTGSHQTATAAVVVVVADSCSGGGYIHKPLQCTGQNVNL